MILAEDKFDEEIRRKYSQRQESDEFPTYHLTKWRITSKGNSRYVFPDNFDPKNKLYGYLEPRGTKDFPLVPIMVTKLVSWSFKDHGIWIKSKKAHYKLKEPEKEDLRFRAKFGLIMNLIDLFEKDFIALHAKRTPNSVYNLMSPSESIIKEHSNPPLNVLHSHPFDLDLLQLYPEFVYQSLLNFDPLLNEYCVFMKSLKEINCQKTNNKKKIDYLKSAQESERRSNRSPWGDWLGGDVKVSPNKLIDIQIRTAQRRTTVASSATSSNNKNDIFLTQQPMKEYSCKAMEAAKCVLQPYLVKSSKIEKYSPITEDNIINGLIANIILQSTILNLELMLYVIESLRISSDKVKKAFFLKKIPEKSDKVDFKVCGGKVVFCTWLDFCLILLKTNKGETEEMIVVAILKLICDFSPINTKKQLQVMKDKFAVDWISIVDRITKFASDHRIRRVIAACIRTRDHLVSLEKKSEPPKIQHVTTKKDIITIKDVITIDDEDVETNKTNQTREELRLKRLTTLLKKAKGNSHRASSRSVGEVATMAPPEADWSAEPEQETSTNISWNATDTGWNSSAQNIKPEDKQTNEENPTFEEKPFSGYGVSGWQKVDHQKMSSWANASSKDEKISSKEPEKRSNTVSSWTKSSKSWGSKGGTTSEIHESSTSKDDAKFSEDGSSTSKADSKFLNKHEQDDMKKDDSSNHTWGRNNIRNPHEKNANKSSIWREERRNLYLDGKENQNNMSSKLEKQDSTDREDMNNTFSKSFSKKQSWENKENSSTKQDNKNPESLSMKLSWGSKEKTLDKLDNKSSAWNIDTNTKIDDYKDNERIKNSFSMKQSCRSNDETSEKLENKSFTWKVDSSTKFDESKDNEKIQNPFPMKKSRGSSDKTSEKQESKSSTWLIHKAKVDDCNDSVKMQNSYPMKQSWGSKDRTSEKPEKKNFNWSVDSNTNIGGCEDNVKDQNSFSMKQSLRSEDKMSEEQENKSSTWSVDGKLSNENKQKGTKDNVDNKSKESMANKNTWGSKDDPSAKHDTKNSTWGKRISWSNVRKVTEKKLKQHQNTAWGNPRSSQEKNVYHSVGNDIAKSREEKKTDKTWSCKSNNEKEINESSLEKDNGVQPFSSKSFLSDENLSKTSSKGWNSGRDILKPNNTTISSGGWACKKSSSNIVTSWGGETNPSQKITSWSRSNSSNFSSSCQSNQPQSSIRNSPDQKTEDGEITDDAVKKNSNNKSIRVDIRKNASINPSNGVRSSLTAGAMGRGRGKQRTLPAWMTVNKNKTEVDDRPTPGLEQNMDVESNNLPMKRHINEIVPNRTYQRPLNNDKFQRVSDKEKRPSRGHEASVVTHHSVKKNSDNNWSKSKENSSSVNVSDHNRSLNVRGAPMGRGRGKQRTLPAWMTANN